MLVDKVDERMLQFAVCQVMHQSYYVSSKKKPGEIER